MNSFIFEGEIPASKSVFNRLLLFQSYFPGLQIKGDSNANDVVQMKAAIQALKKNQVIPCGEAGTVFRFIALRAAREKGTWTLKGTNRLLQRPHEDLVFILSQLGVDCQISADSLIITGEGWKQPKNPINIHREKSSQFASSLLLNAWKLDFPLEFQMSENGVSEGYWKMSLALADKFGMKIKKNNENYFIPSGQETDVQSTEVEIDYSSAFAVATAAALAGKAVITNFNSATFQPDFVFINILRKMGISITQNGHHLVIEKAKEIGIIEVNLCSSPDLFPILGVLCAFSKGVSKLFGAPHLAYKESHRIKKTKELLESMDIKVESFDDGLIIHGKAIHTQHTSFQFDPDQDHRMAMAAGLAKLCGYNIEIEDANVVSKSFPDFWKILGLKV